MNKKEQLIKDIKDLEERIDKYIIILNKPSSYGRWYDSGRRHLESMQKELQDLQKEYASLAHR